MTVVRSSPAAYSLTRLGAGALAAGASLSDGGGVS